MEVIYIPIYFISKIIYMEKYKLYLIVIALSLMIGYFITEYVIKNIYRQRTYIKKLKI